VPACRLAFTVIFFAVLYGCETQVPTLGEEPEAAAHTDHWVLLGCSGLDMYSQHWPIRKWRDNIKSDLRPFIFYV
jgi:hypothetical protein